MEKLKQVNAGYEFNKEGYGWSENVITDESVLAVLETRYNIQIAIAIEYKEGGETFDFTASRQKVLEHAERFSVHPERYIANKGLCVAHFHRMAINWYKKTHLSKWAQELVNNN